jgi:hypothetical protein
VSITDPNTIATTGVVVTAIGVFVAVITIIYTAILAKRQKNLETLLQLSNHLTAWHDDLLCVLGKHNQQALDEFQRGQKYEGPLYIFLALLGANKKFRVYKKYRKVIEKARNFKEEAVREKEWEHFFLDQNIQINWPMSLTDTYKQAMKAISDKAQKL